MLESLGCYTIPISSWPDIFSLWVIGVIFTLSWCMGCYLLPLYSWTDFIWLSPLLMIFTAYNILIGIIFSTSDPLGWYFLTLITQYFIHCLLGFNWYGILCLWVFVLSFGLTPTMFFIDFIFLFVVEWHPIDMSTAVYLHIWVVSSPYKKN